MSNKKDSGLIHVTAGIIEKDGKILIAKKKMRENFESKWEFPGGKVEDGENPEDCLKREIKEELDVEIKVLNCISARRHRLPSGTEIKLYAYRAEYLHGNLKLKEHEDARWVEREELLKFDFYEPDLTIVKDLLENY